MARGGSKAAQELQALLSGGKVPQGGKVLQLQQPLTQHMTVFQSCNLEMNSVADDNGIIQGYQMVIVDPEERHRYVFNFDSSVRAQMQQALAVFPEIGEYGEKEEEQGKEILH